MNDTPTIGIGKLLLESKKFIVPTHQRDFSWTEDEIEQLFIDIFEAKKLNQREYFLGLMVFMPGDNIGEYIILDGQQRIVTTTIILAAIRSWLGSYGFTDDETKIQSQFIGIKDFGEKDLEPRLILNSNNNKLFYDFVINEAPLDDVIEMFGKFNSNHHNYNLSKAIIYTRRKINELFKIKATKEETSTELFDFLKYIRDNVKIVKLNVESEANAFTVFETLNNRGLDLSALDLIKNHLFGKAKNQTNLEEIQNKWLQMMSHLLSVKSEDYLKTYWTSRHGRIQIPKIFPSFKTTVKSYKEANDISDDMLLCAEQFSAIYVADHPLWSRYNKDVRQTIKNLSILGSKQLPPIILSALMKFNEVEFLKLLKLLEVLIVRFQLVVGGRTGLLEIACNRLAKSIFDEKVKRASHAKSELNSIMPTDAEFKDFFKLKQENNSRKLFYLFRGIERQRRLESGLPEELDLVESITIEHILPKNPNESWGQFYNNSEKSVDDFIYRLGNICLLDSKTHKSGSKSFDIKKNDYQTSDLLTTKDILNFDTWTFESIEQRQNEMAEIAVRIWKVAE